LSKITIVDIQHKSFKKSIQGYERTEVDQFLDEIIETLEDEAHARAALEAEISDLRERVSHFKSMEESLHNTLILAQRTADDVKAKMSIEREIATYGDRVTEARREAQHASETTAKVRSELRGLLLTHLALIDRADTRDATPAAAAPTVQPATQETLLTISSNGEAQHAEVA
jgi:cell division initiation protein